LSCSVNVCAEVCGDGFKGAIEACDDSGTDAGDGCSATCTLEAGFTCDTTADPTVCTADPTDTDTAGGAARRAKERRALENASSGENATGTADGATDSSTTTTSGTDTGTSPATTQTTGETSPAEDATSSAAPIIVVPVTAAGGGMHDAAPAAVAVPADRWYTEAAQEVTETGVLSALAGSASDGQSSFRPDAIIRNRDLERIFSVLDLAGTDGNAHAAGETNEQGPVNAATERGLARLENAARNENHPLTRGEAILRIVASLGITSQNGGSPFHDLPLSSPYANAISAANTLGIITGDTDENGNPVGTVRPNEPMNHAEIVTIIERLQRRKLVH